MNLERKRMYEAAFWGVAVIVTFSEAVAGVQQPWLGLPVELLQIILLVVASLCAYRFVLTWRDL